MRDHTNLFTDQMLIKSNCSSTKSLTRFRAVQTRHSQLQVMYLINNGHCCTRDDRHSDKGLFNKVCVKHNMASLAVTYFACSNLIRECVHQAP